MHGFFTFNWKLVEAESRILKQSSEQRKRQFSFREDLYKSEKSPAWCQFPQELSVTSRFPRFISFALPNTSAKDVKAIRKCLLRSTIEKRSKELKRLENERDKVSNKLRTILNSFDFYLLRNALQSNIHKLSSNIVETHAKKLRNLTRHTILPFNTDETVTNMSSHHLSSEQYEALKNGLTHSICPPFINKSDIYTWFELIHGSMLKKIVDHGQTGKLQAALSHLANSYIASHRVSHNDRKLLQVLKSHFETRQRKWCGNFG